MKNLFFGGIAVVVLVGCGSVTTVDSGTGGAGGTKSTSTGSTGTSTSSSNTSTTSSSSSSASSSSSSASASSSSASSSSVSASSSSSGGACGVCPANEVCCASTTPPHCYDPACLACCMGQMTSSSSTGGGTCSPACGPGFSCCNGACVNEDDDVLNCGACGNTCSGSHPYCDHGTCGAPPCDGVACPASEFCCDTECCAAGMLCCDVPEGVFVGPKCTAPVNGTCPVGCPLCP